MSFLIFLRKFPWSLLLAIAMCLAAWVVKMLLEAQTGEVTPFLLFFGAVILATWNGGLGIGAFATLFSTLLVIYFFLPPLHKFQLDSAGWVQSGVFVIEGFSISLLTARARAAQDYFRAQAERQGALAELSQLALTRIDDLEVVFERAAQLGAQTLEAPRVAILELHRPQAIDGTLDGAPPPDYFAVRAAVGPGHARGAKLSAEVNAPERRALDVGLPHGARDGAVTGNLSVPIGPAENPWGVLQIGDGYAHSVRVWTPEQIDRARAFAGVLGVAIAGQSARAKVTQGETRYRSFIEQSSEAIWRFELDEPISVAQSREQILDQAWQFAFLAECNDAFARMYGFERADDMAGMRLWQILDRDDERVRAELVNLVADNYHVTEAEFIETDRLGQTHVFVNNLTGIVEDGFLLRVWGTQRDVTEQRQAARELAESENRFRSLFDAAPVPLGIGRGRDVHYVNHAFSNLIGYENPAELIGRDIVDFVAPTERKTILARALSRAAGGQEPSSYESRVLKRDGSELSVRVELGQITLPQGQATLMFLFDLTAQKKADAAIAELLQNAQGATARAENLREITFDLLRPHPPEDAARLAIKHIAQAVGARGGVLMAPDDPNQPQTLHVTELQGYPEGTLDSRISIGINDPHPMAHVFRTREPLWMDDAWAWAERFPVLKDTLSRSGSLSLAILPLEAEGHIVSVMALSWGEPHAFDDETRLFLQTLANSCALALERARFDTQSRDLARRQQEALALLNTLLDSAPVGFALFDRDGRYVLVNGTLAQMNGKTIDQHLGKTRREVVPEPEPEWERRLEQVWQSGRASGEFVLMDQYTGTPRFCLLSLYPVRVQDGRASDGAPQAEPLGVGAIVIDISQRVRADEEQSRLVAELETERARLEAILQQMPSAVVIAEAPSARMLLGNPQVERVMGKPFVASQNVEDYGYYRGFWPDGREIRPDQWPLVRSVTTGEIVKDEQILVPDDGDGQRIVRVTSSPILDRDGHITAGIATFDDVTERARSEAAQRFLAAAGSALIATLDASSSHHRLAQLCVPDVADWCILAVPGADGLLHRVSIAHAETADLEIARRFQQQLTSDPAVPWDIAGALSSGRTQLYPRQDLDALRRQNASASYVQLLGELDARSAIVAPLAARGRTLGLMIWLTTGARRPYDSHDVELAEELARRTALTMDNARLLRESQQARREAEAANLAKDEFLAVVSHELRTPLTPILGWLDLLRAPGLTEEMRAQAYDVIERNARAQAQLVNDILDVSRITSGKLRLELKPLDLTDLVRRAIESLRMLADKKGVQLRLELEEIGQAAVDSSRFQQVVWNLLSNAIKFTPADGHITISLRRESGADAPQAALEIADNGQGIAPAFLPDVFEAFRQADSSSTRKAGGLGLGLAIVRHIVEMHGGQVSADSPGEGLGATFRVRVPLLPVAATAPSAPVFVSPDPTTVVAPGAANAEDAPGDSLQNARVLLIDDEADTRETLARLLERHGARVRVAASASEALATLDLFDPQIAVSDIGMPDVDGYALLAQLRARLPQLPALALTAYAAPADIERARAAGFEKHLAKPVEARALVAAIGELLKP